MLKESISFSKKLKTVDHLSRFHVYSHFWSFPLPPRVQIDSILYFDDAQRKYTTGYIQNIYRKPHDYIKLDMLFLDWREDRDDTWRPIGL